MVKFDWSYIAGHIDHTLLKPTATSEDITNLCNEALEMSVHSVCIAPSFVRLAKSIVGSHLKVVGVISFPLGYSVPEVKVFEVQKCIEQGADEVDVVMNQGFVKDKSWNDFDDEISAIVKEASKHDVLTKIIIEACNLSDQEKIEVVERLNVLDADFVKTSTGFSTSGANLDDVILLKKYAKGKLKVKAAGGIRTAKQAIDYLNVGADRIGTSSTRLMREEFSSLLS
jgi:deoxyribose-phosphate aldolase